MVRQSPVLVGGYDAAEQWQALLATIALFRWLMQECGERRVAPPPLEAADRIIAHISMLFDEWLGQASTSEH